MREFKSSILADEDVISIFAYTLEKWGTEQLEKYQLLFEQARDEIRIDPYRIGSKAREDLAEGCRIYRVEHHYIIYRLRNDIVEIARILHENMDFHEQMKQGYFP